MNKKSKKILLAEDDSAISKIMSCALEEEGFDLDKASDGQEALSKIESNNYDLFLLDMIMPKKNGLEVLKALKKKQKEKIPILVFSNLSQEDDEKKALELGARKYFVKANLSIDELVDIIKKYI